MVGGLDIESAEELEGVEADEDDRMNEEKQFRGETVEANYILEFLWMTQKSIQGEVNNPRGQSSGRGIKSTLSATGPSVSIPVGYRWSHGQSRTQLTPEVVTTQKLITVEANVAEVSIGTAREEEEAYGNRIGFPTQRRPTDYHRNLEYVGQNKTEGDMDVIENMIGDFPMTSVQREFVRQLLYTWRDLFHADPETMPVTDLVMHTIPTYDHIKPIRSKDRLYSPKEIQWQRENIPRLLKAGVISYCDSPWSAQTKHPVKKD